MKVGAAIAEILKREGVDAIFGYPRNAVLEQAAAVGIRTIIVRQERTGLHMADAYSRLTRGRRMGVFAMQHGPGTENAYGAVAQAYSESVPVLVLPQGYARRLAHVPDNYNACISMRDITKTAEPILRAEDTPAIMRRAFTALRNGRLRPALVEMPWDVLVEDVPEPLEYTPVVSTRFGPDPDEVERVADRLVAAGRLVIHAGQGVHWAEAYDELRALADLLGAPVSTSLEGKSAFDETHPLALGSGGAAIPGQLRHFLDNADLILGIGCSFSETAFGVSMPGHVPIIHATLDPADLNKGVACEMALIGDAKLTLAMLVAACAKRIDAPRDPSEAAAEIKDVEAR
ncbi:MAG: thiamine pyrophosphate-binding protein, partial [Sphingobium sp.]